METDKRFCRNCGTHILAESVQCVFCGSFQTSGSVPWYRYVSESKFFRTKLLYPIFPVLGLLLPVLHFFFWLGKIPFSVSILFFLWTLIFSISGWIGELILDLKFRGDVKDFKEGFIEWQKHLYDRSPYLSYFGMILFVATPLIQWQNSLWFSMASASIWTLLISFISLIIVPLI
ncbi:zinc ribbon domain-containing protein [Leptospira yasudae]|uniref:Zinc ribbon domain-containing protein n=1 Tax=Leptospira yasudae TaxID=2202201 RepID=A0A6N4QHQ2_9LEPT|nr:zinc ribbon domain-containing protein [Leptospira yasudae]TGL73274.1 zinc ribbon domain-containing protein [Leptospira yasudae]TGL78446.1 zinc ribbon domain-containing protein [Leptospira yasudae]TGL84907.1 zinc ribbon domain-containing protein [Leptospira yasudae]